MRSVLIVAASVGFVVGAFVHAVAQPPNRTGVTWTQLGELDLGTEVGFDGHALRGRLVTLPPGGVIPTHNHNDRPSMLYMVEGVATEIRGTTIIEHRPGRGFSDREGHAAFRRESQRREIGLRRSRRLQEIAAF
jgi:hypothetical protein